MHTVARSRRGSGLVVRSTNQVARSCRWAGAVGLAAALLVAPSHTIAAQASGGTDSADVKFMQGMIAHHAQALAMVALIPDHTTRPELQMIGQRIKISQQDEIKLMQRWLDEHHQPIPTVDANNVAHMPVTQMSPGMQMSEMSMMMPGMLTPEQMAQLTQAKGPEFDRLFLEGMIRHHEGALTMVKNLLGTQGAAQAADVFTFASETDADQRAEIKRMRSVLDTITNEGRKS
jgi:uncharacterized protein (DUF305 family)